MGATELSEQEIVRRQNLQAMRDLGIDPYPAAEYPTNAFSAEIMPCSPQCIVLGGTHCLFVPLLMMLINFDLFLSYFSTRKLTVIIP